MSEDRSVYRRLARNVAIAGAAIATLGAGAGWLVAGQKGLVGGLMGAALGLFFCGASVVVMWATARRPLQWAMAALVVAWLAKMAVTIGVVVAVREQDFYDKAVFVTVVALAAVVTVALDMSAIARARIPNA